MSKEYFGMSKDTFGATKTAFRLQNACKMEASTTRAKPSAQKTWIVLSTGLTPVHLMLERKTKGSPLWRLTV